MSTTGSSKSTVCTCEHDTTIFSCIVLLAGLWLIWSVCACVRDLHPGNILLGDRGHILLTYFSQWNTVDQHVSEEALEGLYCAPGIVQFTIIKINIQLSYIV